MTFLIIKVKIKLKENLVIVIQTVEEKTKQNKQNKNVFILTVE